MMIRTVEELDALPDKTVVLDEDGDAWQKSDGLWWLAGGIVDTIEEALLHGPFRTMVVGDSTQGDLDHPESSCVGCGHASDCGTHSEDSTPREPCDCGRVRRRLTHDERRQFERAEKYERMVMAARELLLSQTSGHEKPDSYYRDTPLAVALVDGWGEEDVIALLAALGIMWDGERATLPTLPTVEEMRGEPIRSTPTAIPARLLSGEHVGREVVLSDGTEGELKHLDVVIDLSVFTDRGHRYPTLDPDDVVTLVAEEGGR